MHAAIVAMTPERNEKGAQLRALCGEIRADLSG
jgi:hypothetical protein